MKLSPHFTLAEFTHSQTAARRGISNHPGRTEIRRMKSLCVNVLEPVRTHFGVPMNISSGFRSWRVNRAVGGSSRSQHLKGEAADINLFGYDVDDLFNWIAFNSGLEFDQIIHEFGRWVHISFTTRRPNRQITMRAFRNRGRVQYRHVGPDYFM